MGIKDLSKVIADHCPAAIRTNEMKAYFGRKIAINASMSLYQFLLAVRQDGLQLTNADGETTRFGIVGLQNKAKNIKATSMGCFIGPYG